MGILNHKNESLLLQVVCCASFSSVNFEIFGEVGCSFCVRGGFDPYGVSNIKIFGLENLSQEVI